MKFQIVSHQSVGEIRFGQSPDEVRAVLQSPCRSLRRTPASIYPCDYFADLQIFVNYGDGGAEAVELAGPAEAIFQGRDLLKLNFRDLSTHLLNEDADLVVEDDGCTSVKLGIGAYAPHATKNPMAKPESIIVFAEGYYD